MRVLMTTDTLGGVWVYATTLARALAHHGVRIGLATMGRPLTNEQRESALAISNLSLYESAYRLEWMEDCWEHVKAAGTWLRGIADDFEPDLVHLNNFCHTLLPWTVPRLVVAHSDVFSWFSAVKRHAPGPQWAHYYAEVSSSIHAADLVVAPSSAAKRDLEREYGPIERMRVIPNGIFGTRKALGIRRSIDFFAAGRVWDEAKNFFCLEKIAEKIDSPIYVAGAEQQSQVNHRVEDWCKRSTLHFLGELPNDRVIACLEQTKIYLSPALYEPFGLGIVEAAACGCALVLADIPSLRENWNGAALFCDPRAPEEWRDVLHLLSADESERQIWAERALNRSQSFTAKRMASNYYSAYRELLQSPNYYLPGGSRDESRPFLPLARI